MFLKRRLLVSIYTSIIFTFVYLSSVFILLPFWDATRLDDSSGLLFILIYIFFCALIGNAIVGIPVSIFVTYITKKIKYREKVYSFILHLSFAGILYFVSNVLALFAVVNAALFFFIEERLKSNKNYLCRKLI
jgi:hypothetical protein